MVERSQFERLIIDDSNTIFATFLSRLILSNNFIHAFTLNVFWIPRKTKWFNQIMLSLLILLIILLPHIIIVHSPTLIFLEQMNEIINANSIFKSNANMKTW